jgi:hypothetical protein
MKFAPAIGQIFQEYRDIVIRRLVRIAARTGADLNRRMNTPEALRQRDIDPFTGQPVSS